MSWFNRLFGRGSDDTKADVAPAAVAPAGGMSSAQPAAEHASDASRPAPAAADVPQTPAVENDVLPTPGTGPADAELHEPIGGDRSPAVGESVDAPASESQTPSAVDVEASAAAGVEGADAPARGTGAASGSVSLAAMTVTQLRDQARALGLQGYSRLGKADLIELITKAR